MKSEAKLIKINQLKVLDYNPNEMTPEQMNHLKKTIIERGFLQPVTVTPKEDYFVVIDGAHRLEAYKELNTDEIPCWVVFDKSDKDIKIDLINLNKLRGEFNPTKYAELLKNLQMETDREELKELLNIEEKELRGYQKILDITKGTTQETGEVQVDGYTRRKTKYEIKRGDIWILGKHRVMCGDATDEMDVARLMNGKKANMSFNDPPYNVNYDQDASPLGKPKNSNGKIMNDEMSKEDFSDFLNKAYKSIIQNTTGAIYICMSCKEWSTSMNAFENQGGHWSSTIIWNKNVFVMGRQDYHRKYEPIIYGWPEGVSHYWCADRNQSDVWDIERNSINNLHPTMKPIELVDKAIINNSKEDDLVLDLFGGSGTTLISADHLNRICYMMELDPYYISIIIERWEDYTKDVAKKE